MRLSSGPRGEDSLDDALKKHSNKHSALTHTQLAPPHFASQGYKDSAGIDTDGDGRVDTVMKITSEEKD